MGNLSDLGLGDILQVVSLGRKSGVLTLETAHDAGAIVFQAGQVVSVRRQSHQQTIGEALVIAGVLSPTLYQDMLKAESQGSRGLFLLRQFNVDPETLPGIFESTLKSLVFAMFEWSVGQFAFELATVHVWDDFALTSNHVIYPPGFDPQHLAIEGARLRDEHERNDSLQSFLKHKRADKKEPQPISVAPPISVARPVSAAPPVSVAPPVETSSNTLSPTDLLPKPLPPQARARAPFVFDLRREVVAEVAHANDLWQDTLPPSIASQGDLETLRSMAAELSDPANRDAVSLLVLRFASHVMERAILFLVTKNYFVGLGGFSIDESSDQFGARVRGIRIDTHLDSVFAKVVHYRSMVVGPILVTDGNEQLRLAIGSVSIGQQIVAAPIISGDRVVAILYGDNPSGRRLGATDALEIFLQQAGLAMDRTLLEKRIHELLDRDQQDRSRNSASAPGEMS